jgi:uncharacterized protein (DUF1800 family)
MLTELTAPLGSKRALHFLRRATFGPTISDVTSTFQNLTPQQAIVLLFRATLPLPPLPINPETNQEWIQSGVYAPDQMDGDLQEAFKRWLVSQMMAAGVTPAQQLAYSARERIVFFLHTHFTVIQEKVGNSRSLYFQNALYRMFALDDMPPPDFSQLPIPPPIVDLNFKNLTVKVSVDNAMIALLDGNLNVRGSVNENYARELLELYSIGRGLEGSLPDTTEQGDYIVYKEQDVQAAARVLSGWTTNTDFGAIIDANVTLDVETQLPRGRVRGSSIDAANHDNDVKTFSNRMPGTVQPDALLLNNGRATEASALDEIRQLVDLIYAQPETAKHICRKLYRFFVYHEITPAIDSTIIEEMANTFRDGGYKLQPVIENLLCSEHFYEAAPGVTDDAFGGIIKSPLELVINTVRFMGLQCPDQTTDLTSFYNFTGAVLSEADNQGMKFFQPFDVAGYEAYHQFPIYHRSWINVNYLTARYNFIRQLVNPMSGSMLTVDVYQFVKDNVPDAIAQNARSLVIELCRYFLPVNDNLTFDTAADDNAGITAERLNYFLVTFLSDFDADPEAMWTTRWTTGVGIATATDQLQHLFNALLQSPEYQLH